MSALLKQQPEQTRHYWKLWVAPTNQQTMQIKTLSSPEKERVLMLHPKQGNHVYPALKTAITSQNYQSITISAQLLSNQQQQDLEVLALINNTALALLGKQRPLNSASQLTLI